MLRKEEERITKFKTGMKLKDFLEELEKNGGEQTKKHVLNVANMMSCFADVMDMDSDLMFYIGLLHDAGKIDVNPDILAKTEKLTPEEYKKVQQHSFTGPGIIKSIIDLPKSFKEAAAACAGGHHLFYNGNGGYGVDSHRKRSAIEVETRICSICDVFDAIVTERSYSPATPWTEAIEMMDGMVKNGQFDPLLYKTFKTRVLPLYKAKMAQIYQIIAI